MASLWQKKFFAIGKNRETWFGPPICVNTSGQRKFGLPYEILNMPLLELTKIDLNLQRKTFLKKNNFKIVEIRNRRNRRNQKPVDII